MNAAISPLGTHYWLYFVINYCPLLFNNGKLCLNMFNGFKYLSNQPHYSSINCKILVICPTSNIRGQFVCAEKKELV